jgi:hypothetical protein
MAGIYEIGAGAGHFVVFGPWLVTPEAEPRQVDGPPLTNRKRRRHRRADRARVDRAIKRKGAGSVEEKAEDQDGMEQAEHDLLADLRRARRSLRLQGMDEPPAVARLTPGQRIADAVATVLGSWSFIIVQSAILIVWITANLVGAIRGWDPYPFHSSQSRAFVPGLPTRRRSS